MNVRLSALLLLTAALPALADDDDNKQFTPINRPGHTSSHVLNDENQVQELRRALKQAASATPTGNGINYHGGPVMSNTVTIYYIWYGNWNGNTGVSLLESFAKNLGGSPYYNINTTYSDSTGNAVKNNLIFGGSITDNYTLGKALTDGQIWQTVSAAISSGKFPADANAMYFVLTSADVNATSGFCSQYCGWHTYNTLNGVPIKYSFVGDGGRCASGCTAQATRSPNENVGADGMASVIAHELSETVSDPQLNAWWDNSGQENGDKCAWTFGTTIAAPNGSRANLTLAGTNYLIQQMWVNAGGGACAMSYLVPVLSGISPASGSTGTSVPVTLTGSGFATGMNLNISGGGVTTSNLTVVSPTQITATLTVGPTAEAGAHNVSVTAGVATSSPARFTVSGSGFTLTSVSPATGAAGTTVPVTLTGTGFATGATVAASGTGVTVSNVQVVSAMQITASLAISASAVAGSVDLTVKQGPATSVAVPFRITSTAMSLTGISPSSTPVISSAAQITLTGTNFTSTATVAVSGTGVTVDNVKVVSPTQITATFTVAPTAATGARNVTVSSGPATTAPAVFTVTAAPGVSSISPGSAQTGSIVTLTFTGNTLSANAAITVTGTGVTVTPTTLVSPTLMTAIMTIDKAATPGPRTLSIGYGTTKVGQVTFTITAASTLASISPATALPASTTKVTFTGTGFATNSTAAISGSGVSISALTYVSATQLTANFVVEANAPGGARNVTITSGQSTTAPVTFTVAPSPTLTAITPANGAPGITANITLTGTNFATGATVAVSGSGVTVSAVNVVSSTQITAQLVVATTAAAGARNVTVTSGATATKAGMNRRVGPTHPSGNPVGTPVGSPGNGSPAATTQAVIFTVSGTTTLTSLSPAAAANGSITRVTFTGTNFTSNSTVAVTEAGVSINGVTFVSPTQLTANLVTEPVAAPGNRMMSVRTGSVSTTPLAFTVTSAPMTFTSISPAAGTAGSNVIVTFTGTHFTTGATIAISGSGVTAGVSVSSATQLMALFTIDRAATAGARNVTVTNASGTTTAAVFTIMAPAVLTRLDKMAGAAGTSVNVVATGTGFATGSTLAFSGTGITVSNSQIVSATQLNATLTIASTATTGARTVTVGNSMSTTPVTFTVTAASTTPKLTAITPATGVLGNAVTVTLIGTGFTPNTTVVTGDADLPVLQTTYVSATQLTAMLGLGGTIGAHGIRVAAAQSTAISEPVPFTITAPPTPTATNISPASGAPGRAISVTITGTNFTPDMVAAISGTGVTVGNFSSGGPTTVTFPLTIAANAPPGARTITIRTPGGTSNTVTFTVSTD